MNIESKSTFTITSWKDEPEELEGGMKLTRTKATQAYQGAISGNGMVEYLMYPGAKAIVHFVGFECITGTLDGKAGSFTIQHMGTFAGEPHSNWSVVPGSGTGELTASPAREAMRFVMELWKCCLLTSLAQTPHTNSTEGFIYVDAKASIAGWHRWVLGPIAGSVSSGQPRQKSTGQVGHLSASIWRAEPV